MRRWEFMVFLILISVVGIAAADVAAFTAESGFPKSGKLQFSDEAGDEVLPENPTPGQIEKRMAGLSDEQVRRLLLAELRKNTTQRPEVAHSNGVTTGSYLHTVEGATDRTRRRLAEFFANIPNVPQHLRQQFHRQTHDVRKAAVPEV